jgi:protein TonB
VSGANMSVMAGATGEPPPVHTLGALNEDDLFATGLATSSPPRRSLLQRVGATSFALHLAVVLALILIPIFTPPDLPARDYIAVLLYDPPPPPPPPLPKGTQARQEPEREIPKPVTEKPAEKPEFTAPIETETPTKVAELKPEESVPLDEQFGSELGSVFGVPVGLVVGVVGGVVGGIPGGVLGGVLGGTGTGPVLDYDSPPRPIKTTKPVYPQEAFVKKIEGVVVVEIVIDSTGRVVRARVLQSVPLLDAAALQCVYQWVFQPAVKHGRPVTTIAHAPVTFRIY